MFGWGEKHSHVKPYYFSNVKLSEEQIKEKVNFAKNIMTVGGCMGIGSLACILFLFLYDRKCKKNTLDNKETII